MSYADACRAAATQQGLNDFTDAAKAAGLTVEVQQTGGFTMVAVVTSPSRCWTVTHEDGYVVVEWPSAAAWDEAREDDYVVLAESASGDEAVALICDQQVRPA